jgi:HlyD family secretion protein
MMLTQNRGGTSDDVRNAQAQYLIAESNLDKAKRFYDNFASAPEDSVIRAQAFSNYYNAQQAFERAKNTLNYFLLKPSGRDIDEARAKLALAEAQLEDAQRTWERLRDGPDEADLRAAQARVDAAQATIQLAHVRAPFAGTVTEVSPMVGDQVSPGTAAFRVDDLSHLLVDVQVSEVDINSVRVGQPVEVTLDAVYGKPYEGKVIQVASVGTSTQGAVNFEVTVELIDPDDQVRPGMTAAVTVTVQQLEDVLLVPNRAVRLVDGTHRVYVMQDGVMVQVEIRLGATSDTVSQVLEGLEEGDLIVLNPPTDLFQGPPNGGGQFGP